MATLLLDITAGGRVADDIVERVRASIAVDASGRTARDIAAAISRMITNGELPPGERLPTVRELARRLGISPTTVSEAWRVLSTVGAIDARGRRGTFVIDAPRPRGPRRYRRVTEGPGHFALDLSTGTPDPSLLPELGPVLARVARQTLTTSYLDHPVVPALEEALRARWPFVPEALTVVDGAMDALDRVTSVVVRLGDRVLVENPCFPPLLDLLEQVGAEPIGLAMDDQGVTPEALRGGLEQRPVALYLQPRAQNPFGVSLTPTRARRLAGLLRATDVVVIEDDHAGDIAASELVSIGAHLPARTVHIRSFSKSHGPDLRLAAVGGAGDVIAAAANRRLLGPGWSSRVLQYVLVEMLDDPATIDVVERARTTYADRRKQIVAALDSRGIGSTGADGINLWVDVRDEQSALLTLASRGVGAAPGAPFMVNGGVAGDHLRLTVGLVRNGVDELADLVAVAANGPSTWSRGL
jgi:DNA-binding transcriptional MocR family regulator